MLRDVTAHFESTLSRPGTVVYSIAVARGIPLESERIDITVDGRPVEPVELIEDLGTRLHKIEAAGRHVIIDYEARGVADRDPLPVSDIDLLTYLRPSRYCESDSLGPTAMAEFRGTFGTELITAVGNWVQDKLVYVSGASKPTDGAEQTLLARQGVCRDYAHLAIALLRAMNIPARMAAVYAPGLIPMEFHAVAEAYVDGRWLVVDATRKAPRQSLVRVATGRDAADTAFITNYDSLLTLGAFWVTAVARHGLPNDDHQQLVALG